MKRKTKILPEYDFSKGGRGKYSKRYAAGTNLAATSKDPDAQIAKDRFDNPSSKVISGKKLRKHLDL